MIFFQASLLPHFVRALDADDLKKRLVVTLFTCHGAARNAAEEGSKRHPKNRYATFDELEKLCADLHITDDDWEDIEDPPAPTYSQSFRYTPYSAPQSSLWYPPPTSTTQRASQRVPFNPQRPLFKCAFPFSAPVSSSFPSTFPFL